MAEVTGRTVDAGEHCGYCGDRLPTDETPIARFGERFCSAAHADEFVAGVRAARMNAVAESGTTTACTRPAAGQRTWKDSVKRSACWGAPLLLLLALPLVWSGNAIAAAGGSVLSIGAVLAGPLGMYFMMRAMGSMTSSRSPERASERREDSAPDTKP